MLWTLSTVFSGSGGPPFFTTTWRYRFSCQRTAGSSDWGGEGMMRCLPHCVYHTVSTRLCLPDCVYHTVSTTLCLPHCVYQTVSTTLCLPHCVYQSVFTRLCLPHCVYQTVFTRLCLPHCVYQTVTEYWPTDLHLQVQVLSEVLLDLLV